MATEAILDKHTNLEVGEVLHPVPSPGVTPMPVRPPRGEDDELLQWMQKEIKASEKHVNPWREQFRIVSKFVAGDQYDSETRRRLKIAERPDTAINTLQKYIAYVSGLERRAPQALIFQANVVDDALQQAFGEFATNSYDWAVKKCLGHYERSRAFEDLIVGGMAWTDRYLDKLRDPRGLIQMPRVAPLEMLWPDCAEDNLRTTRWRARESLVDRDDAIRQWPEYEGLIRNYAGGNAPGSDRPELDVPVRYTVPYIETVPLDKQGTSPEKRGKVSVLQFQWYTDEPGWTFTDPVTQELMWLSEKDFAVYKRRLQVLYPTVRLFKPEKAPHRVVRQRFILERRHFLNKSDRLPGDLFTLACMTGHFDEDLRQWYGFARVLMDPQRYGNTFFRQALEITGVAAKGGVVVQTDAFKNQAQKDTFAENYAKPGSVSEVDVEALEKGKIKEKTPGTLPPAAMAMVEFCIKSMDTVTGLNASGWGLDAGGGQLPALTMRQKQQVSTLLLAKEFDALSRYRLEDEGPGVLSMLPLIADGRLIRVGGDFGAQVIPLLKQPFYLLEYDMTLDDTEHDPTLRQVYSNFLIQAGPMLAKQGMFVPEMLDYLPFPVKIRRMIIQQMKAAQQQRAEAAAKGINLGGRGTPRDPRETAARVEKLQSDALMHRARAMTMLQDSKREDLRALVDSIQGFQSHGLDEDRHKLERARHGLDTSRHHVERTKATVDMLTQMMEALKPPEPKGQGNG